MVPAQAGMQHPLPTLNIPSSRNRLHALGSKQAIIFSRRTSPIQVGGERKAMGEPGHDGGGYRHLSNLSPGHAVMCGAWPRKGPRQNPKRSLLGPTAASGTQDDPKGHPSSTPALLYSSRSTRLFAITLELAKIGKRGKK